MHAVGCASAKQQGTRRRQANFLYRQGADRPCGNAMKPVGPQLGEQVKYLVGRRSECAHAVGRGQGVPKQQLIQCSSASVVRMLAASKIIYFQKALSVHELESAHAALISRCSR
eukprot:2374624-Pleurochrysis_carterae.AAC.2